MVSRSKEEEPDGSEQYLRLARDKERARSDIGLAFYASTDVVRVDEIKRARSTDA